ncbi:MAG TPA: hypothetical protein DF774_07200, partial [Rheinheimera sp.]|uniref:TubC N-terminal docking domain-related protein n=1 Tax=Rheinheimera sp. TaxID=1869214 RepID=UPI000EE671F8
MKDLVELLSVLELRGIELRLDDEQNLRIKGRKELLTPELTEQIRSVKPQLVSLLQETHAVPAIQRRAPDIHEVPLSYA